MITKFATVYAGHVDLPDMGQDATPANERRFSNEQLVGVFEKTDAVAKCMDDAGYYAIWLAEHHFQHEGYEVLPNLLIHAVHLAHVTKRIKIGCGFNIAPMWHPLRLAEDYAVADILTKGRTIFGLGRGYHSREVETFGAPILDQEANRELFEEQVEIIFKAFNSETFSHQGKHYTLPPNVPYRGYELRELTLVPRPVHLPVECWQPIVSAKPREKAIREIKPFYEEHVKMFGPLGFVPGITPAQLEASTKRGGWDAAGVPTVEHYMKNGAWFAGPPEELTAYLKDIESRYPGLEYVNVSISMGTPKAVMLEQLQWFATEVMPTFTARG